jgi:hypothetical protein
VLRDMTKCKYLTLGLIVVLVLCSLQCEVEGKIVFCKHCRETREIENQANGNNTHTSNVITAPSKCKAGMVLVRNKCRKMAFAN